MMRATPSRLLLNKWLKKTKMPLGQVNHLGDTGQALLKEQTLYESLNHCL